MKGLKMALAALLFVAVVQEARAGSLLDKAKNLYTQYAPQAQSLYQQGQAALPAIKNAGTQASQLFDKYGHIIPTNTLREGANTLSSTWGEWAGR